MSNKIKKILVVFTVVCLMYSLAVIPVNAAVTKTYSLAPGDTVEVDGSNLFGNIPVIYPGEAAEFDLKVINNDSTVLTVTMTVTDISTPGANSKNLAEVITLIITRTDDNSLVYNGPLLGYNNTRLLQFQTDSTTKYNFRAEFDGKSENQNEYMSLIAKFVINLEITRDTPEPTTESTTEPTTNPTTEPTTPVPPPTTTNQPQTVTTTETTDEDSTTEGETTTEPAGEEPTTEEFVDGEEPTVPIGVGDLTDDTTEGTEESSGGVASITDTTEPAGGTTDEEAEVQDNTVPLKDGDFISKMPTTGENMNPFAYMTAGLTLALTGGIIIVGASKKSKEQTQKED